jgi:hypothetical protein
VKTPCPKQRDAKHPGEDCDIEIIEVREEKICKNIINVTSIRNKA